MKPNTIYAKSAEAAELYAETNFHNHEYIFKGECDCGETNVINCYEHGSDFLHNEIAERIIICEACYEFYKDKRI